MNGHDSRRAGRIQRAQFGLGEGMAWGREARFWQRGQRWNLLSCRPWHMASVIV